MSTAAVETFTNTTARHMMIMGPRGIGKTYAMREAIIGIAKKTPTITAAFVCKDHYDLMNQFIKPIEFYHGVIPAASSNGRRYVFANGSRIDLLHVNGVESLYRYSGLEYDVIGIDEATRFSEEEYKFIESLNRSTKSGFPRMFYTSFNIPREPGRAWVKRLFVDNENAEKKDQEYALYRQAPVNVFIPGISCTEHLSKEERADYLFGSWDMQEDAPNADDVE